MRLDDEKLNHDNTLQNCNRAEKKLKETTKAYNDAKLDLEQVRIFLVQYDDIFKPTMLLCCSKNFVDDKNPENISHF